MDAASPTVERDAGGDAPITGCANVVVDRSGRLGELSYLVPDGLEVRPGDAVRVPFGARVASGVVVGAGDPARATREIDGVWGARTTPRLLDVARRLAVTHFTDMAGIAARLAPPDGKDAEPLDAGPVELNPAALVEVPDLPSRQLLVCGPLVEAPAVAAVAAARLADRHPVLVLCPTRAVVDDVLALLPSGAARLEGVRGHDAAAWAGFRDGSVAIGVGTRTAALWSARRPAAVVVVDEAHPGHREASQPYTHAREVASARTKAERTPLVLVSASAPTAAALGCGVKLVEVGTRKGWPELRLIDRGQLPPEERALPPAVRRAINTAVRDGARPVVVCDRWRPPWRCERCGERAELDGIDPVLTRTDGPGCARCGHGTFRRTGWDAERVRAHFGDRVDPIDPLGLTEVRDRGLVVILDVDRPLRGARLDPYVAGTRLVVDASRAAGAAGRVIAVTADAEEPLWQALFRDRDLTAAARCTWDAAKAAGLPPFGRLVWVRVRRATPPDVSRWPGRVLGPAQRNGEWEIAVSLSQSQLPQMAQQVGALRRRGKARVWVD